MAEGGLDWRAWKKGWQYKGDVDDPEYLKARSKLFKENGNGWWWYEGFHAWKESRTKLRERRAKLNGTASK